MKIVTYYCPGCKREIERKKDVATRFHESVCEKRGRLIRMLRRRWRRA